MAAPLIQRSDPRAPIPRLAYSVPEAAASLGVSTRTTWHLIARGALRTCRIGKRVLVPVNELARFVAADTRPAHQEEPNHAR